MKKAFNISLGSFPFIIVFIGSLYNPGDPDLGWHLKYGEYFFKTGRILRDNTFSILMPDYNWANTSWGTDLITYVTYNVGGFLGLTLLSAFAVTLTFYFFSKSAKLTVWDQIFIFPLLLYLLSPINSVSFRGQQLSLLFLGILFYVLSFYPKRQKILYILIPLFLLWANIHGQFLLGLVMLFLWIMTVIFQKTFVDIRRKYLVQSLISNFLENKKEILSLLLIFLVSLAATFINPFGLGVHKDALSHISSPLLKNIVEYLPFSYMSTAWWNHVVLAIFLVVGLVYLCFKEKISRQFPVIISGLFLFMLSFSVRRYAWPAYYLILPLLKPLTGFFRPDSKKATNISTTVLLFVFLATTLYGKLPFDKYVKFNWSEYCKNKFILCSPKSARYLEDKKIANNLFSLYGWGGYLIWNHLGVKPTIDGRMHMWRDQSGKSGFEEYYAIEQNLKDIDKSSYKVAYMAPDKPVYNRLVDLTKKGKWKVIYKDNVSGIFIRNK